MSKETASFVEVTTKSYALKAAGRKRKISPRHSKKTYRYSNTGQLARNIKKIQEGKKYVVNAGSRANYTNGYHGMYFLVEKRGGNEVKRLLKDTKRFTESLKL